MEELRALIERRLSTASAKDELKACSFNRKCSLDGQVKDWGKTVSKLNHDTTSVLVSV